MSFSDEILNIIYCNASEKKHILNEPILLQCGHSACKRCAIEKRIFRCNYESCNHLNVFQDGNKLKIVKSIDILIQSHYKELYENTVGEFNDIIRNIEDEGHENVIDKQGELIEARIHKRAEFLKNQIDTFTNDLCSNLERKKQKLKR
jgi:hypothetical protein